MPLYNYEKNTYTRRNENTGRTGKLFSFAKRYRRKKKKGGRYEMTGKNRENYNANYIAYVNSFDPPTHHFKNCFRAFMVGGLVCCIGQFLRYLYSEAFGLVGDELSGTVSVTLIFIGCLLTGLGVYDRIGRYAGGGSIVPITGFANSVCSPAMEFKTEGLVYGMAAKMFIVAGPIIVYGVLAGTLVGVLYLFL